MAINVVRKWLRDNVMNQRVLIVEDEFLIALDLEATVENMGMEVAGLATNKEQALQLAPLADVAFVDVNLSDGATGPEIGPGTIWTRDQCDARLKADLVRYANEVSMAIGDAPTTQAQFDALVSFHYNSGAIARATLTRKHCAGDHAGAATEFARWNRAGGRVMPGLTRRRAAEARLYRGE